MNITTVGIDLAKNVFQLHGVDARGKAVLRKTLKRKQMMSFLVQLPPCLIGMEACGSAHFWARKLTELGHTVKLMAPQFVKPYVKTNKNDARDAEAICEAVARLNMRFVPLKSVEQQGLLAMHRARDSAASQRLERIPGIGPLTASALVASIGDAKNFKNARQLAAWLGLVPRQDSSGGKVRLLGISKRGDTYLRTLLIHGARSVLRSLKRHPDQAEGWLARLAKRRNPNIAAVALANKNARIVWALLAHDRDYQAGYVSARAEAAA